MTPKQIRALALHLYTVVFESEGVAELALWQRCLGACKTWDVAPPTAMLISEALTCYLADHAHPRRPLVTPLAKAQAVLHQAVSVADDGEASAWSARTRLTPSAIADMVGWALTVEEQQEGRLTDR
jgi:hypothetical protein